MAAAAANDDDVVVQPNHQSLRLEMEIQLPFIHPRTFRTWFCGGAPIATQWNAIFEVFSESLQHFTMQFSLFFDPSRDERDEIVAQRLQVDISLNDSDIVHRDEPNVLFSRGNTYKYSFWILDCPRLSHLIPDTFIVIITIDLPAVNQGFYEKDVAMSRDMLTLVNDGAFFSNMRLRSVENEIFHVHTYILRVRCNRFYAAHTGDAEATDISSNTLRSLLRYLYSGQFNFQQRVAGNAPLNTELFQVIFRYGLFHAFQTFLPHHLHQRFINRCSVSTSIAILPLERVQGSPSDLPAPKAIFPPDDRWECALILEVSNPAGPWLSYRLESSSSRPFYAQVTLEIAKVVPPEHRRTQVQQLALAHQCLYYIPAKTTVDSGGAVFLGCPETLRDVNSTRYEVHCTLKCAGTRIIKRIQIVGGGGGEGDCNGNISLLADHLFGLRREPIESDLKAFPLGDERNYISIHKAIFGKRFHEWWKLFGMATAQNAMPDAWHSEIRSDVLPRLLDFLYTGRIFTAPNYFDEIYDLADLGKFHTLSLISFYCMGTGKSTVI